MPLILSALLANSSTDQRPPGPDDQTIIVTAPGNKIDDDDATSVRSSDLESLGSADLTGALTQSSAAVSLSEAQSNPYQPNLVYRGFEASPLQGTAQGLAVYVDGGRFNLPFGDTVNFDLIPEAAIKRATIKDTSPIYGLNALGGILAVETKSGRGAPGGNASVLAGDHGRAEGTLQLGGTRGEFSGYLALERRHDGGWRVRSPSDLTNGFADVGWDRAGMGVHLKAITTDTDLTGNGPAPVELLAADPHAVFTTPDRTINHYGRLSIHPYLELGARTRLQVTLYAQHLRQRTTNGDIADIEPCPPSSALLCLDGQLLTEERRLPIAALADAHRYGVLNHSLTRTTSAGALVQVEDRRHLLAGENELTVGFSCDRSRTRFNATTELGELAPDREVVGLASIIDQLDGAIAPVSLSSDTAYTGLFVSDTLPITNRLEAELGARWNDAKIDLRDQLGTSLDGSHHFARLNAGAELSYRLLPGLKLRAGYAESSRAPTPAELSCADPQAPCSLTNFFLADPPLKQVTARNMELGALGRFGRRWHVNWRLSAYRTLSSNDIQFVSSDIRGRAFFRNIGSTRRQGVDAEVTGHLGPWSVRTSYAFTDATFRTGFTLNSPDNPGADESGRIVVRPGARIPSSPRHRGTLSLDYQRKVFAVSADLLVQSGQVLLGDEANLQPLTKAFATIGRHGSIALSNELSIFGNVSNLLNAHYATFGTFAETASVQLPEALGASDPRSLSPGAPRRVLVGLRACL